MLRGERARLELSARRLLVVSRVLLVLAIGAALGRASIFALLAGVLGLVFLYMAHDLGHAAEGP